MAIRACTRFRNTGGSLETILAGMPAVTTDKGNGKTGQPAKCDQGNVLDKSASGHS